MPRKGPAPRRDLVSDPIHHSVLVTQIVNKVMLHGKRSLAEHIVYEAMEIIATKTGEESTLDVTGMFVAIGHDPRSELVRGQVDTDSDGYVDVRHPSTATKIDGVFACGDLVDHTYRQAITAAGSGCSAAIDAERWLAEHAPAEEAVPAAAN